MVSKANLFMRVSIYIEVGVDFYRTEKERVFQINGMRRCVANNVISIINTFYGWQ